MFTRRRFIRVSAAAAGLCAIPGLGWSRSQVLRWRGTAMGADASITLAHPDEALAERLVGLARAEIERMESMFSLYRRDSDLSRLNRTGRLTAPTPDFPALLTVADGVHRATGGLFDPTMQPLWRLYAEHFAQPGADPLGPADARIEEALARMGWANLEFDAATIAFARPEMALSLNGIAQGYATDRVADLLKDAGLDNVLVSVGEYRALGMPADGDPWRVAIAERGDGEGEEVLALTDRALATSAPRGTTFDLAGKVPHILNPRTGRPSGSWRRVSAVASSAAVADALSTAMVLMDRETVDRVLDGLSEVRVIAVDDAGARFDRAV